MSVEPQFGNALRDLRRSVLPTDVGLPADQARRTPGLRREELAGLAAISTEYVKRLEQNRAKPSLQVVEALGQALGLSSEQHDHLSRLAGLLPTRTDRVPQEVSAGVERLLERLDGVPVAVFDAAWTLIGWNESWAFLVGDASGRESRERNLVWRQFNDLPSRVVREPGLTERFETSLVADLRAVCGRYPRDTFVRDFVADLRAQVPRFAALWERPGVAAHQSDRKTVIHPELGSVTVDCDVLTAHGSDLRLVAYTAPPGSDDAQQLERVRVLAASRAD